MDETVMDEQRGAAAPVAGSKVDTVYRWLRAAITDGRLRPKERVNADQVSRVLAVSKIPVREAIARLVSEGALVTLPHAGAVVRPLSWRELADIQQARLLLEPPMGALAARDPAPAALADLRRTSAELRRWAEDHQGDPFALTRGFHLALVGMAGNDVVQAMTDLVLHRVSRYRVLAEHTAESALSAAQEHDAIIDALAARDGRLVERLLVEHLQAEHTVMADARAVDPRYFVDAPDVLVAPAGTGER